MTSPILGRGRAAGKVILFGEHAVVYGRPALAVPVTQVWAEAVVEPAAVGTGITVYAADLGETVVLREAPADQPLAAAVRLALAAVRAQRVGGSRQDTEDKERQAREMRQRTKGREQKAGNKGEKPASSLQSPASSFQLPAASFQLPASSLQLPASSFQPPASSLQLPASSPLPEPDWHITVRSTIPVASGMGSGAAVTTAIVRAVAEAANQRINESANQRINESANQRISESANGESANGRSQIISNPQSPIPDTQYPIPNTQSPLPPDLLSALVYEVERLHHGTPSGIDNTVIAYEQPVYFVRGRPPEPFAIGRPFTLVIADTGIRSPTRIAVGDVRRAWEQERGRFEALFDRIAAVVEAARTAIAAGRPEALGPLMDENHALLREVGVSCPELDALVTAARSAGALGAKLSGAGRGGNMIAAVAKDAAPQVAEALRAAGAVRVIISQVGERIP